MAFITAAALKPPRKNNNCFVSGQLLLKRTYPKSAWKYRYRWECRLAVSLSSLGYVAGVSKTSQHDCPALQGFRPL
jgi:hypothetical protein